MKTLLPLVALAVLAITAAAGARPTFTPIGPMEFNSQPVNFNDIVGVTDNGVIAGNVRINNEYHVARWSPSLGLEWLTPNDSLFNARAEALSAGGGDIAMFANITTPFLRFAMWTATSVNHTELDLVPTAMSADASLVALASNFAPSLWDRATGTTMPIFIPPSFQSATVSSMSDNGQIMVGSGYQPSSSNQHALMWNGPHSAIDLHPFLGAPISSFSTISGNGSVFLGHLEDADFVNLRAFKWSFTSGVQLLQPPPDAPPHEFTYAAGCSADGSIIIAMTIDVLTSSRSPRPSEVRALMSGEERGEPIAFDAFLVTPQGSKRVITLLEESNVDLEGWTIDAVWSISRSGRFIAGRAQHEIAPGVMRPETFIIDLWSSPPAAPCPGDADSSGQVNFNDVTSVLANFNQSCN